MGLGIQGLPLTVHIYNHTHAHNQLYKEVHTINSARKCVTWRMSGGCREVSFVLLLFPCFRNDVCSLLVSISPKFHFSLIYFETCAHCLNSNRQHHCVSVYIINAFPFSLSPKSNMALSQIMFPLSFYLSSAFLFETQPKQPQVVSRG